MIYFNFNHILKFQKFQGVTGWATPGGADDIIVVVGRTYVGVVRPTGIVCTHYQMPGNLVVHM